MAAGFSLVEVVLTITILGVLAYGFGGFFLESTRAYDWTAEQAAMSPEARLALNRLLREASGIRDPGSIYAMTGTQLAFKNVDNDSLVVAWSGTPGAPLTLSKNGTNSTLAAGVDSLGISCFTSTGAVAVLPAQVWRIRMRLRLARGTHQVMVGSSVYVRNQ